MKYNNRLRLLYHCFRISGKMAGKYIRVRRGPLFRRDRGRRQNSKNRRAAFFCLRLFAQAVFTCIMNMVIFFKMSRRVSTGLKGRRRSSGSAASGGFPVFDRRRIIRLYVPVLIEQALATFITMFGTVMVSGVSASAVSGVGLVDSINMLVISVFTAIATGRDGHGFAVYRRRRPYACRHRRRGQSLVVCVEAAAVAGVLLALFARPMLRALFGHAEQRLCLTRR